MNPQRDVKWLFLFHVFHFPSKFSKEEINTEKAFWLGYNRQRMHFVLKRLYEMKRNERFFKNPNNVRPLGGGEGEDKINRKVPHRQTLSLLTNQRGNDTKKLYKHGSCQLLQKPWAYVCCLISWTVITAFQEKMCACFKGLGMGHFGKYGVFSLHSCPHSEQGPCFHCHYLLYTQPVFVLHTWHLFSNCIPTPLTPMESGFPS